MSDTFTHLDTLNRVYKVFVLDALGEISQIILFLGEERITESKDSSSVESKDSSSVESKDSFKDWLEDEFKDFPNIVYSHQQIHIDDSVRILKKKILHEFTQQQRPLSYDEIYLFGQADHKTHLLEIYRDITEEETVPITKSKIAQILVNFDIPDLAYLLNTRLRQILETESYEYADLVKLDIFDRLNHIDIPIGLKFANRINYLFSSNPYNILGGFDLVQPDYFENPLISFENQLLLNYGTPFKDSFFVCLAENTFEYAIQNGISQEYMARTYYPQLASRQIISKSELLDAKPQLIENTKKIMSAGSFQLYKQIDMLYDIYFQRRANSDFAYTGRGIRQFSFVILTNSKIVFPLEYIFKNIHASLKIPFIKFHPGPRQENMYRLFCNRVSKDGRKIPFLPDSTIMKLSRETAKKNAISLYLHENMDGCEIFLDFEKSGDIRIYGQCKEPLEESTFNKHIQLAISPIIDSLNLILKPTGNSIEPFKHLRQENVQILTLDYQWSIIIDKKFELIDFKSCFSALFDIAESTTDIQKGISTRFKRVENFKEMDAQFAFMNEIFQVNGTKRDVINGLVENYGMTEEQALIKLGDFIRDVAEINGKVMENPGFPVFFQIPIGKQLIIRVDHILSMTYVDVLSIYIDSILRITQLSKSIPNHLIEWIQNCKRSKIVIKDVTHIENVVAPVIFEQVKNQTRLEPIRFRMNEVEVENTDTLTNLDIEEDDDDEFQRFLELNAEEEEEEEEEGQEGGDGSPESPTEFEGVVDGMPLHKPNPFEKRLKKADPVLFLTKPSGKFKEYSRVCPSNVNRQPVVISDKEKEEIDRLYPGSYEHAIKHGSDENHSNWYICPRYWCLLSNASMTEDDVRQGKCAKIPDPKNQGAFLPDKIIPENASTVPKGTYVYEFKSQKEHVDKDGKYIPHYPGFLGEDAHPDGQCVPCCFKKLPKFRENKITGELKPLNPPAERQMQCAAQLTEKQKKKTNVKETAVDYVMNASAFPLPDKRLGFLPISIQLFLQIDASKSVDKNNSALIAEKKAVLLRMGVESSEKHSFLAAMASIYSHFFNISKFTILEMREKITAAISLDDFVRYHNASLLSSFRPKMIEQGKYSIDDYENTDFVKRLESKEEDYYDMMIDTIASYENFKEFLLKSDDIIDYTYLWDILSDKNNALFPSGLNLVILENTNNDITDNVRLICPTNHYSQHVYHPSKPTVILLKQGNYYEPIYIYYYENVKIGAQTKIQKRLRGYFWKDNAPQQYDEDMHGAKNYIRDVTLKVNRILEIIHRSTVKHCSPKISMPRVYEFKRNLPADELYRVLVKYGYTVNTQILNYQGQVIGFLVSKPFLLLTASKIPLEQLYIPSFPSAILRMGLDFQDTPLFRNELPSKIMDSDDLWKDYGFTIAGLNAVHRDTKGNILCKPHSKIKEGKLIVGILTETNQFIQIDPPSEDIFENDGLITIQSSNFLIAEKEIAFRKEEDPQRAKKIKDIELESNFFIAFRTLIRRFLLDDFEHRGFRKEITTVLQNIYYTYKERIQKIAEILKNATKEKIVFCEVTTNATTHMSNISELYSGLNLSGENETGGICLASKDNTQIHFPKKHFITGANNEVVYYARIADELVRYKRIQQFLFHSNHYLDMNRTEYKINHDELFLLQSLLTYEYFQGLIPFQENKYIHYINYSNANPLIHQTYANEISLEDQYQLNHVELTKEQEEFELSAIQNPNKEEQEVIGKNRPGVIWNHSQFPTQAKELIMKMGDVNASYYPIIYILYKITGIWNSVDEVRVKLMEAYSNYMELYKEKIFDIWKHQGKYRFWVSIQRGHFTWREVVLSKEYMITSLDIWIFADFYNIPIVLFSSTKNKLANLGLPLDSDWVILNMSNPEKMQTQAYFFIRGTGIRHPRNITPLHLIKPSFLISDLKDFQERVKSAMKERGMAEYRKHLSTLDEHLIHYEIEQIEL
jgi:hypothetical protein